MNDGLKNQQRNAILGVLNQHPKIERAVLFGSRAMGTFTPTSDIDIALYGDLTLRDQAKIADELEQLSIPYTVDLVRMKTVTSPELLAHIKEHGRDWKLGGRGMVSERRYIPASEFCSSVRDGTHDSPKPVENGHKLVTSRNLTTGRLDLSDAYLISKEDFDAINKRSKVDRWDVLISMIGTVGEPCLIKEEPDFAIKNIGLFKTKSEADGKWLYYFLRSNEAQQSIREQSRGTTQQYIPLGALRSFPILVCDDPEEQKTIASVLGALDDKIELNRRMNATLEAMARSLFQSWFVDFDPVRAKLDGRQPVGLDPTTAKLFPEHLEDSPLGHIPKGWKATTLGACIGFRSGFSFKSQDWQESGVPVVKIGSVKPGIIDLTQVSYVSEEIAQQAARYRLCTGDMLIGMTGYVGEVGLVPPSDNPPLLNQRVGKFVMPKPGTESLAFWYCATRQPEFKAFVEARSHGTAQANVSGESIMEFPLVVPPSEILDAFNRDCQPLFDHILANHGGSRTLATLRDTLLPKLLSGEVQAPVIN